MANTLAYYDTVKTKTVKSFIVLALGVLDKFFIFDATAKLARVLSA